jgi:nickel/cobalt transporter (NicO) family protein
MLFSPEIVAAPVSTGLIALTAFLLGCVHALEPGHGKSMIAAFIAGQQSRWPQLVLLSATVTLAHVLSVAGLALVGVLLVSQLPVAQGGLVHALHIGSGGLIIVLGCVLLWRQRHDQLTANTTTCCDGPVHHQHQTVTEDPSRITADPQHALHGLSTTSHWASVVTLGFASGLTPCPVALSALTLSLAHSGWQQWPKALAVLVVFSMGLGLTLGVVGLLSARLVTLLPGSMAQNGRWLGFISAVLMIGLGLVMTLQAVVQAPPSMVSPQDQPEGQHWQGLLGN